MIGRKLMEYDGLLGGGWNDGLGMVVNCLYQAFPE